MQSILMLIRVDIEFTGIYVLLTEPKMYHLNVSERTLWEGNQVRVLADYAPYLRQRLERLHKDSG